MQSSLSIEQKNLIREELARILASPLFCHSKRFPDFLRYTVNRALDEDTDSIKERTLGVEVFGRDANYDTSLDPVVRMTAVEIRKRLAQYYQLPNHEREPRIDFERGSYVPEFRFLEEELPPQVAPATASVAKEIPTRSRWRWLAAACVILPSLLISGLLLGGTRRDALDLFWSPVIAAKSPVLICMPDMNTILSTTPVTQPPSGLAQTMSQLPLVFRRDKVSFGDSMAVSLVTGLLGSKAKEFSVRHSEDVDLDELKQGPVLLIGGYSNQWAMELDSGLRYSFVRDGNTHYIRDELNPSSRQWTEGPFTNGTPPPVDYALISRVQDSTTGRTVVTVAGIHQYGTQAAGDCITKPSCIEQAEKLAPGDWTKSNIQILVSTTVIGENPGEPRVLAAHVW
jgi:hypothetical protein